jgi:predicted peptidase
MKCTIIIVTWGCLCFGSSLGVYAQAREGQQSQEKASQPQTAPSLATLIAAPAVAQTGFLDRLITLGGEPYRYQVYVPADYTPSKTWPVIVSLHGNGRQGSDGMLQTGTDFAIRIRENRAPFPAIVVFPQGRLGTRWFYPQMQQLVMAELDRTIAEFRVDTTRIYLHGYSMGATGSYRLAYKWPERFAAVVVVAGRVEPGVHYTPEEIDIDRTTNPVVATPDPFSTLAARLRKTPLWIFHGDADAQVPVDQSRRLFAALKSIGAPVRYTELPGADHDTAPPKAYADAELFRWLLNQRAGHE